MIIGFIINIMNIDSNKVLSNNKEYIEKLAEIGVFEYYITGWIMDYKQGSLTKQDILNVTEKVAQYRGHPSLLVEIQQRINFSR